MVTCGFFFFGGSCTLSSSASTIEPREPILADVLKSQKLVNTKIII